MNKNGWLHGKNPSDLRKPRVGKDVEIITDLIKRHGMHPAPAKTELHGDWFQVVVPITGDHVAYLTLPDEAVDEIEKIMGVDMITHDLLKGEQK